MGMKKVGSDVEVKIDVENSKVLVNGVEWKSIAELKEEIKNRVDGGDFNVINLTVALKKLESMIEDYQEITVKIHKDTLDDYHKLSNKIGIPVEKLLRSAIETYTPNEQVKKLAHALNIKVKEPKPEVVPEEKKEAKPEKVEEKTKPPQHKPKHHKPVKIECKNCGHQISISAPQRPIIIRCSKCGTKNRIDK